MGFFSLQDGKDARQNNTGSFALDGGGDFEPIPAKTKCKAVIDEIAWDQVPNEQENNPGIDYIKVRWSILSPAEYKNRKVFQKLWVSAVGQPSNNDPLGKRGKDIAMLAAVNANCPGQPLNKLQGAPNDADLSQLKAAVCLIDLDVWEIGGRSGNWVRGIEAATAQPASTPARRQAAPAPAQSAPIQQQQQQVQPVQQQQEMPNTADNLDDEIPF